MSLLTTQINREALSKALALARPALSSQSFVPVLSHICFASGGLFAYNDAQAIWVKIDTGIDGAVPGELLTKVIGSFSSDSVSLEADGGEVIITSGRSRIKLPLLGSDQFVFQPMGAVGLDVEFDLDSSFLNGIECCLMSVGNDPTRPNQLGITLAQGEDGNFTLYSTDNVTLSSFSLKTPALEELATDAMDSVILPTLFCQQLVALAKAYPDSQIRMGISGREVVASTERALVFSKLIIGAEALNFKQVISSYLANDGMKGVALVDSFQPALERSILVSTGLDDPACRVQVVAKSVTMVTESPSGRVRDNVTFSDEPGDVEFAIDPNLALRASKVCSEVCMLPKVLVFKGMRGATEDFKHLVAHRMMKQS